MPNALAAVPRPTVSATWEQATAAFLRRDLAPGSRRIYGLTLAAVAAHLPEGVTLGDLSTRHLAEALHAAYPSASPNTWNRYVATLRSFSAFCARHGWLAERDSLTRALERRRAPEDHSKALERDALDRLLSNRDIGVRDRCLWRVLYESAARANEVLRLNVEDVDLPARRAVIISKGGDTDVLHFASGTARLLPKVIAGRSRGPLFLTSRPPAPSRTVAMTDLDPTTCHARLSTAAPPRSSPPPATGPPCTNCGTAPSPTWPRTACRWCCSWRRAATSTCGPCSGTPGPASKPLPGSAPSTIQRAVARTRGTLRGIVDGRLV